MRRTRRSRLLNLGIILIAYSAVYVYSAAVKETATKDEFVPGNDEADNTSPNPLYTTTTERTTEYDDGSASTSTTTNLPFTIGPNEAAPTRKTYRQKRNCTPPAIDQFPPPIMGPKIRERGGLIIHILIAIFTFLGLAIVCDDYFVSSLDRICEGEWFTNIVVDLGVFFLSHVPLISIIRIHADVPRFVNILNEIKSNHIYITKRRGNTFFTNTPTRNIFLIIDRAGNCRHENGRYSGLSPFCFSYWIKWFICKAFQSISCIHFILHKVKYVALELAFILFHFWLTATSDTLSIAMNIVNVRTLNFNYKAFSKLSLLINELLLFRELLEPPKKISQNFAIHISRPLPVNYNWLILISVQWNQINWSPQMVSVALLQLF